MKTKFTILALVIAVPAFLLGRVIWPDVAGAMEPSSTQLPFFIFISALEALSFGIGVAFIVFGYPKLKNLMGEEKYGALPSFIAIAWFLVSWWPHDNMHRANGMDLGGLLRIEYLFHLTLIIAGLTLAYFFGKRLVSKNTLT